jgi:pimeloyl-ACP methyl ester carboxylesterase
MSVQYLERTGKPRLAYVYTPAEGAGASYPVVMFLGGYRSDMNGTKALYLEEKCAARGQAYLRFDYSGHGQSAGTFDEGTIGSWMNDALDVLDHVAADAPVVLVGSSMGGWISLLVARARAGTGRIKGLVGIAAAPDFTEDIYARLSDAQKAEMRETGRTAVPNDYSDTPYTYTQAFYDDGKAHLLLRGDQRLSHPVRLIQGMLDNDVPWETAVKIRDVYGLAQEDVIFVEDGDHRLSRPEDLVLIDREVQIISGVV